MNEVEGNERERLAIAKEGRGISGFASGIGTPAFVLGIGSGREAILLLYAVVALVS